MPSPDEIQSFYNDPRYATDSYFTSVANLEIEVRAYKRGLAELSALLPVPKRLLDVGCGNGQFIAEASRHGWSCDGVELSHTLAEEACHRTAAAIFELPVEDLDIPDNSYDAITMWDLLEHLAVPRRFMRRAWRALKPGGVLLIYTPDYDRSLLSLLARASYLLTMGRVQVPMQLVFGRAHLIYHSRASIQRLCHETGYDLRHVIFFSSEASRHITYSRWLRYGVETLDLFSSLVRRQYRMLAVCVSTK